MIVGQVFSPYRQFTGYWIPECLMGYQGISPSAKLCLSVLYRYMGKGTEAWPSQDAIAEKMGCSLRSVTDYLTELQKDKFIRSERRGLGMTNMYVALWHYIFEEPETTTCAHLDTQNPAHLDTQDSACTIKEEENQFKRVKEDTIPPTPLPENFAGEEPPTDTDQSTADFVKRAYRRPGRKIENLKTARAMAPGGLYGQIEAAERRMGALDFRRALEKYLETDDDYLRSNRWPIRVFLKSPEKYLPDKAGISVGDVKVKDFIDLWNEVNPTRQSDPTDFRNGKTPPVFLETDFVQNMPLVCQRAAKLFAQFPHEDLSWLKPEWLFKSNRDTGKWNYKTILDEGFMRSRDRPKKSNPQQWIKDFEREHGLDGDDIEKFELGNEATYGGVRKSP